MMDKIEGISKKPLPWKDAKLNVLIPMAGAGSRFSSAGYTFPKPLIEVRGNPMIQVVELAVLLSKTKKSKQGN